MSRIGDYVKQERKRLGLTQEKFAVRTGLGLRFVRDLEQGKETVRMDKVNQALALFDCEAVSGRKERGTSMFSGCGIINERGLLELPDSALLFFYTMAGGKTKWSEGKNLHRILLIVWMRGIR